MKHLYIIIALLTYSKNVCSEIQAPPPPPQEQQFPQSPTEATITPIAPPQAVQPSSPVAGQDQAAQVQAQPAPGPVGDVIASQMSWPDTIAFAEDSPDLNPSDLQIVIDLFKAGSNTVNSMSKMIHQLSQKRAELHQQYFDLNMQINEFYQEAGMSIAAEEDSSKADVDAINANIHSLSSELNALKEILAKINTSIDQVGTILLATQKNVLEIIKQKTAPDAQKIMTEVEQARQEILKQADSINNDLSKQVEIKKSTIASIIEKTNTLIQSAKEKAASQLTAEQVSEQKVPTEPTQPQQIKQLQITPQAQVPPVETFLHYLTNRITGIVKEAANIISSTYVTTRETISKKIQGSKQKQPASSPNGATSSLTPVSASSPQPLPAH